MVSPDLIDAVSSLSPEEQDSVLQFISYLKSHESSPFLRAAEQFMAEHPEILHNLSR
jgi:hypothetical protein